LAILSLSLLSYGISGAAYAAVEPLTVLTEEFYGEGNIITISGFVKNFDASDPQKNVDVTIMIISPNGSIVTVAQVSPSSDGSYSTASLSVPIVAGGPLINAEGDYIVKVQWQSPSTTNQTTFKYGGSSGAAPPPPPPPEQAEVIDEEPPVDEEPPMESSKPVCGPGTVLKNNVCVAEQQGGGGCLIATAAFGSEMAPQVQFLREIRDNTVLQTQSGSTFMTGFNQFYYSFSPAIADYERENPAFKEAVKIAITPMLTSLAILNYVDIDSEEEMLGYGIGIILLNIGMYFVAPAAIIFKIRKRK
jgi:hypothetical protein